MLRLPVKCSSRHCNVVLRRSLHSGKPILAAQKAKRSKKTISELPTAYVLADGNTAPALPPWNGSSLVTDVSPAPKGKSRKPRTKKAIPHDAASSESAPVVVPETSSSRSQLAREILSNLQRFPDCLLLTRVGSFYESYFDQANEVATLLNIKLTSRKWDGRRVPMCGFPLIHLDKYLKVLVQQHKRSVAMCEEFALPLDFGAKEFERRITRIITPGTLIDEPFLEPSENNFLLSVVSSETDPLTTGLAWIDVSTGEFYSKQCPSDSLEDELTRISPKEVVLDASLKDKNPIDHPVLRLLKEQGLHVTFPSLDALVTSPPQESPSVLSSEAEAVALLHQYVRLTLLEYSPSLGTPMHESDAGRLHIDAHTIKALELRETDYDSSARGSLMSVIRRTVTTSGTRLLSRRLCSPSGSVSEIQRWQSTVAFFLDRPHLSADLREMIKNAGDLGRLVQKLTLRKGAIDDLVTVKKTIELWTAISARLQLERKMEHDAPLQSESWEVIDDLINKLSDLSQVAIRIDEALQQVGAEEVEVEDVQEIGNENETAEELPGATKWHINPNFSPKLSSLHDQLQKLLDSKHEMQLQLQTDYNAPSLTLRTSGQQGMHVHLSRARRDQTRLNEADAFVKLAESASTKTYVYQPWSQLGGIIGSTSMALAASEKEAFQELMAQVLESSEYLKTNATVQDELDVALGFATLARELQFTRPTIVEDDTYNVVNGRHPSVEMGLLCSGRTFTPNTIEMTPASNMHVITGPNMAGKSTALRQTALIVILAQIGSFVPAESATIGVVDKLFTRIGAKDDLFRDRSTFMVEMMETADILNRATSKSLVIMDEVGRGTTMKDGLAIAFATIHHLVTENQTRCLFATHFHELSDMLGCNSKFEGEGTFSNVRFFCTNVEELAASSFVYSYRLQPGVNRDSHGLKVAQLAGVPPSAIAVARKTLSWLNNSENRKEQTQLPASFTENTVT